MNEELLTQDEKELINKINNVSIGFRAIMLAGRKAVVDQDRREIMFHIHALQNHVLAQAAARAYPKEYRLLGDEPIMEVGLRNERD